MFDFLKQQFFKFAIYVSELPFVDEDDSSMLCSASPYFNDMNTDGTPLVGRAYGSITEI
jgi:hypothetical protein